MSKKGKNDTNEKRKTETLPFAVTCRQWQEYHKQKELKKARLEKEKMVRKESRIQKKKEKEEILLGNKKSKKYQRRMPLFGICVIPKKIQKPR